MEREYLLLSRYLAGSLSPKQAERLESRLFSDPDLRAQLDELKRVRVALRWLPEKKAPRAFTLKPGMIPRPKVRQFFPSLSIATAICGLLFAISLGTRMTLDTVRSDRLMMQSAPNAAEMAVSEPAEPQAFESIEQPVVESEATPTNGVLLGAPPVGGSGKMEETPAPKEGFIEDTFIAREPVNYPLAGPVVSLPWIFGSLTLLLLAVTAYFYHREHL